MNTPATNNSPSSPVNKPKEVATPGQDQPSRNPNHDNPNPYLRRYGSHVKSHFSQSRCEFFESSEDEDNLMTTPNNVNSLNHINDIKAESKTNQSENNLRPANQSQFDQVKQDFLTESGTLGKSPSIDSGHSPQQSPRKASPQESGVLGQVPTLNVNGENADLKDFTRKDSLELELEGLDDGEDDRKSALIIKSRRDSVSQDSFDEGGNQIQPEKQFVNKHFQNGKVVDAEGGPSPDQ